MAIKDNGLGEVLGGRLLFSKEGRCGYSLPLDFWGRSLWSPVLGRRDLASLVDSFVAESTVPSQESGRDCEETIHATPKDLRWERFPLVQPGW